MLTMARARQQGREGVPPALALHWSRKSRHDAGSELRRWSRPGAARRLVWRCGFRRLAARGRYGVGDPPSNVRSLGFGVSTNQRKTACGERRFAGQGWRIVRTDAQRVRWRTGEGVVAPDVA
ncbi:formin-like protein 16 [Iris pallida]|uniref:Formin-like protein 16 n=1 Tax=Iris pallida TaxID=29817 RepID=A0AAX6HTT7_IRIPA|nr:formin-like protein 16 [Iris pallida]